MAGDEGSGRLMRVRRSLLFVAGFSAVFILLGAGFGLFGAMFSTSLSLWGKIAGAIVVLFGLHYMGVIRISFLMRERRFHPKTNSINSVKAFFLGSAFALGWTPCVGPILASILFLASQTTTLLTGMLLLSIYSLGLGIPFIVLAYGYERMHKQTLWLRNHMKLISYVSGGLLIAVGVLIFFGTLQNFTGWVLSLGAQLTYLSEVQKRLFDIGASALFLAIGCWTAVYVGLRKRRGNSKAPWRGIVLSLILVAFGVIGIVGLVTPTQVFSSWLSWQGL
jgi:cytochrome c-type biogenesis protein